MNDDFLKSERDKDGNIQYLTFGTTCRGISNHGLTLKFFWDIVLKQKYDIKGQVFMYGEEPSDIRFLSFVNGMFILFDSTVSSGGILLSKQNEIYNHEDDEYRKISNEEKVLFLGRMHELERSKSTPLVNLCYQIFSS